MNEDDYEWLRHEEEEEFNRGCLGPLLYSIIFRAVILFCCLFGSSCTSQRFVEHEAVRHDTCYIDKWQRDSIHVHDSIYLHEWQRGETIYVQRDRWHTAWREKIVHDSIYIARTDTTFVTETREVPASLTRWQKAKMNLGLILLGIIAALGIIGVYKLYRMFRS